MSKTITIIDSMMGTGKTSFAIQMMKEAEINQKFILVTPFLDEVQRIKQSVTNRDFKEPDVKHGSGTKLQSLKRLIANGQDIATTHSLFASADKELYELLRFENYTLIMDEVMDVISLLQVRKGDVQMMLKGGAIEIVEDFSVIWKEHPKFETTFSEVRDLALAGNLFLVNNTLIWNFPAEIFDVFEQVYIMTYMFDGQLQRYYYDLHNIEYEYFSVVMENDRYKLNPKLDVKEDHSNLKEMIHIYEGDLNDIGENKYSLSKEWFRNSHNVPKVKQLKNNLYNYFRNLNKAPSERILWTTFKDFKKKIEGNGFRKVERENNINFDVGQACFIPFNMRAINRYKHKDVLAFCLNRYMNPIEKHFFEQQGVKVDEDLMALSDLLQWIFRSAVRDGKPIHIYVPSRRMRDLLKKWLNNELPCCKNNNASDVLSLVI